MKSMTTNRHSSQKEASKYSSLLTAANGFRERIPWAFFGDIDLFVVEVKDSVAGAEVDQYYCSILGSAGLYYGLCCYRGLNGLSVFQSMRHKSKASASDEILGDTTNDPIADLAFKQDCLMVEFTYREELSSAERSFLKEAGFKCRGFGYPRFFSYVPGQIPVAPTEGEYAALISCLEAASIVAAMAIKGVTGLLQGPKGTARVFRKSEGASWEHGFEPLPKIRRTKPQLPKVGVNEIALATAKRSALNMVGVWELGIFRLPLPVIGKNGPVFPLAWVLVDRDSGFIFNTELVESEADVHRAASNRFLEAVLKMKQIPTELFVDSATTKSWLDPIALALKFEVSSAKPLKIFPEVRRSMEEHMRSPRGFHDSIGYFKLSHPE